MELTFVIVIGLMIGSFLNVCIYRIPINRSVVKGRSYCPGCGSLIRWYENIPVLSYIFLRGRCHCCRCRISPVYPLVELLNAALYVLLWLVFGLHWTWFFFAALFSVLVVITFIDLDHQIIPDGLVLMILILGAVFAATGIIHGTVPWYQPLIGFFAASLPLYVLSLIYEGGMGGGDIKLMAAVGVFIGWKLILLSLFLASLVGCLAAIFLLVRRKGHLKTQIPFGPFLSAGIVLAVLYGGDLVSWYLSLIS